MTARETLLRDYRAAFLRYLSWHEESALHSGYQLGRGALAAVRSMLEVVQVHHDVLAPHCPVGVGLPRRGSGQLRHGAARPRLLNDTARVIPAPRARLLL